MALRPAVTGWLLAAAAALVVACAPTTDRDRYEVGDAGTATLRNQLAATTFYLGGCGHFEYERRVGRRWVPEGSDIACIWEGVAQPVPPGSVVVDPITARAPGTWRLRYPVGVGCRESAPLSACDRIEEIVSNEFEVVEGGCVVGGCSGQVCAADEVVTTCEWLPQYACYRDARCGPFGAAGACDWEPTAELAACLEANGANLSLR